MFSRQGVNGMWSHPHCYGSVISIEGIGGDAKATIRFVNLGEKTLLLKFARYKVLK